MPRRKTQKIPLKVRKALKLRKKGLSYGAIARKLNISRTRAFDFCNRDPKSFKGKNGRPVGSPSALSVEQVRKARLVYYYAPNPPSIRELAVRHNVSKVTMQNALRGTGAYVDVE